MKEESKLCYIQAYNKLYDLMCMEIRNEVETDFSKNYFEPALVESIRMMALFKQMEIDLTERTPYLFEIGERYVYNKNK